jgi:hypothetical protein
MSYFLFNLILKPCIRLLINRHNNKYSYTNTSDDNILKNIELFERMAIKFKNRIMFIKDTASTEEICCWYFHGNGKKLSEVCCTSIVYTTEKKQTKVEFPDSKILEEIFVNAVLFESKETAGSNENTAILGQQLLGHHNSFNGVNLNGGEDENTDDYNYLIPPPRISISNGAGLALNLNSVNSTSASTPSGSNSTGLIASNVVGSVSNSSNVNSSNPNNIVGSTSSGVGSNCIINSASNNSSAGFNPMTGLNNNNSNSNSNLSTCTNNNNTSNANSNSSSSNGNGSRKSAR